MSANREPRAWEPRPAQRFVPATIAYSKIVYGQPCIECSWSTHSGRIERRGECRSCGGKRRTPLVAAVKS